MKAPMKILNSLSVSSSRLKKSKKKELFLDFLTPEEGTERLSRNGHDH
jgi:hypothetical protein